MINGSITSNKNRSLGRGSTMTETLEKSLESTLWRNSLTQITRFGGMRENRFGNHLMDFKWTSEYNIANA